VDEVAVGGAVVVVVATVLGVVAATAVVARAETDFLLDEQPATRPIATAAIRQLRKRDDMAILLTPPGRRE
jgi:hypothetical protein